MEDPRGQGSGNWLVDERVYLNIIDDPGGLAKFEADLDACDTPADMKAMLRQRLADAGQPDCADIVALGIVVARAHIGDDGGLLHVPGDGEMLSDMIKQRAEAMGVELKDVVIVLRVAHCPRFESHV